MSPENNPNRPEEENKNEESDQENRPDKPEWEDLGQDKGPAPPGEEPRQGEPERPPEPDFSPFSFRNMKDKPFNLIAFFFAPFYYIGYGQVLRGVAFFLLSLLPIGAIVVSFWAGFRANKELPVGEVPFNWRNVGIAFVAFAIVILWAEPQLSQMMGERGADSPMSRAGSADLEGRLGFSPNIYCAQIGRRGGLQAEPICLDLEKRALERVNQLSPDAAAKQVCLQYARAAGGSNQLLLACLNAEHTPGTRGSQEQPSELRQINPRFNNDPLREL